MREGVILVRQRNIPHLKTQLGKPESGDLKLIMFLIFYPIFGHQCNCHYEICKMQIYVFFQNLAKIVNYDMAKKQSKNILKDT